MLTWLLVFRHCEANSDSESDDQKRSTELNLIYISHFKITNNITDVTMWMVCGSMMLLRAFMCSNLKMQIKKRAQVALIASFKWSPVSFDTAYVKTNNSATLKESYH